MVQQQWLQLKLKFLLDCHMKIVIYKGGLPLVGGESTKGIFPAGRNKQIFG